MAMVEKEGMEADVSIYCTYACGMDTEKHIERIYERQYGNVHGEFSQDSSDTQGNYMGPFLVYTHISCDYADLCTAIQNLRKSAADPPRGGVLLLGILLAVFPLPVRWFAIEDICRELVYGLLGMFLAKYIIQKKELLCRWYVAVAAGIVAVILFVSGKDIAGYKITGILMIYAMLTVAVFCSQRKMRMIQYIGTHAFTIFIYSWPIQAVVELTLAVVIKSPWYVIYPCMFSTGLVGPLIIYEVYIRFLPKSKFLDRMIGA